MEAYSLHHTCGKKVESSPGPILPSFFRKCDLFESVEREFRHGKGIVTTVTALLFNL